jgi:hypothetical protein
MLMLVTGSVQVDVEVVVEAAEVVFVQVIAVLTGAEPQEIRPKAAASETRKQKRRLMAPLSSLSEIAKPYNSLSMLILKMKNNSAALANHRSCIAGFRSSTLPAIVRLSKRSANPAFVPIENSTRLA